MASTPPPSPTIQSLQAGRALAALAVVLHHAALAGGAFGGPFPGHDLLIYGYLGVDFFFVLSGFIIYHSTVGRGRSAGDYSKARVRRVYLPYLPIGIGMALLYTALPQVSAGNYDWGWFATLTLLPIEQNTALSVAWTLKHEILFYFLFGLLHFNRMLLPGVAIWGAAIILNAGFGFTEAIPLKLINLEFLMGMAVAMLAERGKGHPALALLSVVPFAIWISLGATNQQSVWVGAALALLILPIIRLERRGRIRVPAVLVFLGAASYSIYLVHGLIISVVARLIAEQPGIVILLAGTAASVPGGIAYYWFLERPLLRRAKAKKAASAAAAAALPAEAPIVSREDRLP